MLITEYATSVLILALILDRVIGDPDWLWSTFRHPVKLFGSAIDWCDRRLNDPAASDLKRRRNGLTSMVALTIAAAAAGTALTLAFQTITIGWALETLIVTVLLAQKSLLDHVRDVVRALREDGVPAGRKAVSRIVGRDVSAMTRSDICRAAIESAAENFSDGTIAPAFWYLVCGLPGLLVYKMVNTADSMIGHRNETYLQFGYGAAKLDDLLNYIPARVTAGLIVLVAPFQGSTMADTVRVTLADANEHVSPNAGWPEAAMAGAIHTALGGPRSYKGQPLHAPWLNAAGEHDLTHIHVQAATNVIDTAWLIVLIAIAAFQVLVFF